jgi:hypothetical protein
MYETAARRLVYIFLRRRRRRREENPRKTFGITYRGGSKNVLVFGHTSAAKQ